GRAAWRERQDRRPGRRETVKTTDFSGLRVFSAVCGRVAVDANRTKECAAAMTDLAFVALTVAVFALLGLVVRGAGRL
ncbi:hypothetical protein ACFQ07_18405, partial [Actinomadura adrarensis]